MLETAPDLSISTEKLLLIGTKPREFDAKDVVTDAGHASNGVGDAMLSVLEAHPDDAAVNELTGFIRALTEDDQVDLVALTWLGPGDGGVEQREELRAGAARAHNNRTAAYLLQHCAACEPPGGCSVAVRHFPATKRPEELRQLAAAGNTSWPNDPSPASGSACIFLSIRPSAAFRSRM